MSFRKSAKLVLGILTRDTSTVGHFLVVFVRVEHFHALVVLSADFFDFFAVVVEQVVFEVEVDGGLEHGAVGLCGKALSVVGVVGLVVGGYGRVGVGVVLDDFEDAGRLA